MSIDFAEALRRMKAHERSPKQTFTFQCTQCLEIVVFSVMGRNQEHTTHYRLETRRSCFRGTLVRVGCRCVRCFERWTRERLDTSGPRALFVGTKLDVVRIVTAFSRRLDLAAALHGAQRLSADDIVFAAMHVTGLPASAFERKQG